MGFPPLWSCRLPVSDASNHFVFLEGDFSCNFDGLGFSEAFDVGFDRVSAACIVFKKPFFGARFWDGGRCWPTCRKLCEGSLTE